MDDAIGVGIKVPPLGADTDTRSAESVHLMLDVPRGSLACSLITPMKMVWVLEQGLLTGSSSRVVAGWLSPAGGPTELVYGPWE